MASTLFVLDPGLTSLLGHYFEYARSLTQAATERGLRCAIACHRDSDLPAGFPIATYPTYSAGVWQVIEGESYRSARNLKAVSDSFVSETRSFLAAHPPARGDIVFLPNIATAHVLGAGVLAEELGSRGVHVHLMFRYPHQLFDGTIAAGAFRRIESAAHRGNVTLWTDSHRLADNLGSLTALPFRILPIPHTDRIQPTAARQRRPGEPLNVVSLGNARGEKGMREILAAIRASAAEPWADKVRFSLQINDPSDDIKDAIETFARRPDGRVKLIDRRLDSQEYYDLLKEADVVLVPYDEDTYRERTSGIFAEALLAGKVTICTRDTWMGDILWSTGSGIGIPGGSAKALSAAIGEVVDNFDALQVKAEAAVPTWQAVHSPANMLAHLLDEPHRPVVVGRRRRTLILFPWGDAISGASGAAARLRLLVKKLEDQDHDVYVLFLAYHEHRGLIGARTKAESYNVLRFRSRLLKRALAALASALGDQSDRSFHLWYHLAPYFDDRLRKRCAELVRWADDVFLEYSYLSPIVTPLCRSQNKPLVLTQYDVVSVQSQDVPFVHWATRMLEFRALRIAPRVVVASETERLLLERAGLAAEVIPHPIDIDSSEPLFPRDVAKRIVLGEFGDRYAGSRRICLFVGSGYAPNVEAVARVKVMAEKVLADERLADVVFVVAGRCHPPLQAANFVSLGLVSPWLLAACYAAADIVLVPITRGTGTSIKSIEALAHGAVVLSTRIGMRGLGVEHGRHCCIEDDLSVYPARIAELLGDTAAADRLRTEAKRFAAALDYRAVFNRYGGSQADSALRRDKADARLERRREAIWELGPRLGVAGNADLWSRVQDWLRPDNVAGGRRVFLVGYYGFGLVSDDAVLQSLAEDLWASDSATQIAATSAGTTKLPSPDIRPVAISSFAAVLAEIQAADLVIIGGGGVYNEDNPYVASTYMTARQQFNDLCAAVPVLCACVGKPCAIVSVGVFSIKSASLLERVQRAFQVAGTASVRDAASLRNLTRGGERAVSAAVVADPVFRLAARRAQDHRERGPGTLVGVSLRHWSDDDQDKQMPQRWEREVAAALDRFIEEHDAHCRFLPFQNQPELGLFSDDVPVIERVRSHMQHRDKTDCIAPVPPPSEMAFYVRECDVMVCMRYHSVIMTVAQERPFVALGYSEKIGNTLKDCGLDRAVIELRDVTADAVFAALDREFNAQDSDREHRKAVAERQAEAAAGNIRRALGLLERQTVPELESAFLRPLLFDAVRRAAELEQLVESSGTVDQRIAAARTFVTLDADPEALFRLGRMLVERYGGSPARKGDLAEAEGVLSAALNSGADPYWCLFYRGVARYHMQRYEHAVDDLDRAAALRPDRSDWVEVRRAAAGASVGSSGPERN